MTSDKKQREGDSSQMTKREKTRKLKTRKPGALQEEKKTGPRKLIIGVFFVLLIVQVALSNSLVSRGREINELSSGREELLGDIVMLENELARTSSLATIREGAKELGMRPGKIEFLKPPPLASLSEGVKITP